MKHLSALDSDYSDKFKRIKELIMNSDIDSELKAKLLKELVDIEENWGSTDISLLELQALFYIFIESLGLIFQIRN